MNSKSDRRPLLEVFKSLEFRFLNALHHVELSEC